MNRGASSLLKGKTQKAHNRNPNVICIKCNEYVEDISAAITCNGTCGQIFHADCAILDTSLKQYLKQGKRNLFWVCDTCVNRDSSGSNFGVNILLERIYRLIMNETAELKSFRDEFKAFKDEQETRNAQTKNLLEQMNNSFRQINPPTEDKPVGKVRVKKHVGVKAKKATSPTDKPLGGKLKKQNPKSKLTLENPDETHIFQNRTAMLEKLANEKLNLNKAERLSGDKMNLNKPEISPNEKVDLFRRSLQSTSEKAAELSRSTERLPGSNVNVKHNPSKSSHLEHKYEGKFKQPVTEEKSQSKFGIKKPLPYTESRILESGIEKPIMEPMTTFSRDDVRNFVQKRVLIRRNQLDRAKAIMKQNENIAQPEDPEKERQNRVAYAAFLNERLPILKKRNPEMRLADLKDLVQTEWKKSPSNPNNQMSS